MNTSPFAQVSQVEMAIGRRLDEAEQEQLETYLKGRALAVITPTEGWSIALATLESFKNDAVDQLLHNKRPGDPDQVLAQHAVAWGMTAMYEKFLEAIDAAVNCQPPQFAEEVHPDTL